MISCNNAIKAAAIPPLIGKVNNQENIMFLNKLQSTFSLDRKRPTNTIDPTLQCVLLMGMPKLEAINTVNAAPISMQNPLQIINNIYFIFVNEYIFLSMVWKDANKAIFMIIYVFVIIIWKPWIQ